MHTHTHTLMWWSPYYSAVSLLFKDFPICTHTHTHTHTLMWWSPYYSAVSLLFKDFPIRTHTCGRVLIIQGMYLVRCPYYSRTSSWFTHTHSCGRVLIIQGKYTAVSLLFKDFPMTCSHTHTHTQYIHLLCKLLPIFPLCCVGTPGRHTAVEWNEATHTMKYWNQTPCGMEQRPTSQPSPLCVNP